VLEISINALTIAEIGVRIAAMQGAFFSSTSNLIDTIVALLCLLALTQVGNKCTRTGYFELSMDALVLIGRNVVQGVRIWRIVDR
jgi:hypothetical protein